MITQRRWSELPRAAISVKWSPKGGDAVPYTWYGETVDPRTYEWIDVSGDQREAERRQAVLFPVAGVSFRRNALNQPMFAAGRQVHLVSDPHNQYDPKAIEVRDAKGERTVGFVPRDRIEDDEDENFAQGLLHHWLAQGPVAAVVVSERLWFDDDVSAWRRGGISVLAGRSIECVEVPVPGDEGYADFAALRRRMEAEAWPRRRMELRREIDAAEDAQERNFAIEALIRQAYRLRDDHPDALDDAVAACREQIALAPRVAASMRQQYGGQLPAHHGFKQLAIILEKQKLHNQAAELVEQARSQGWDGDWDKRLERLRRRHQS